MNKLVACFVLLLLPLQIVIAENNLQKVSIQLRWYHQFQFAGYYAAVHKGFYKDVGLEVKIKEGGPDISAIDEVLHGRADFGVSTAGLIKSFLEGKPVLILAPIIQHSPEVLLVKGQKLKTPLDVAKAGWIGLQPGDESIDLKSMFINEGIALSKLKINTTGLGLDALLSGDIVAMNAYISNEPFILHKQNIPYTTISPANYGMDFYSDVLFTHSDFEKKQAELVASFRAASLKGWHYAINHQDEIIGLILAQYNTQAKSRDHLIFEAKKISELIGSELVEIGHSNPGRWQHIAETYVKFGVIKPGFELDAFFYNPNPPPVDLSWLYRLFAIVIIVMLAVSSLLIYLYRINQKLRQATAITEKTLADQRQFIALISHEFRTPLSVIDSSVQLLAFKFGANENSASVVNRIRNGVKRLTNFINNYLTSDRLEGEGMHLHLSEINLQQLVKSVQESVQLLSSEHKIIINLQDKLATFVGDEQLMNIMLLNLLTNAIKYSPKGGEVILNIKQKEKAVLFEVTDQGQGIPAEELPLIFDKYKRGKAAGSFTGAGLGLFLVKKIATLHGGTVSVESLQGKGSRFIISIMTTQP